MTVNQSRSMNQAKPPNLYLTKKVIVKNGQWFWNQRHLFKSREMEVPWERSLIRGHIPQGLPLNRIASNPLQAITMAQNPPWRYQWGNTWESDPVGSHSSSPCPGCVSTACDFTSDHQSPYLLGECNIRLPFQSESQVKHGWVQLMAHKTPSINVSY